MRKGLALLVLSVSLFALASQLSGCGGSVASSGGPVAMGPGPRFLPPAAPTPNTWTMSVLSNGTFTEVTPRGINDAGVIVGDHSEGISSVPLMWASPTSPPAVLPTAGGTQTIALGINNAGQIVGSDESGALIWASPTSVPTHLATTPGAASAANGISNTSQIVGFDSGVGGAAFWASPTSGPTALPLDSFPDANAQGINAGGQIVGSARGGPLFWGSPTTPPIVLPSNKGTAATGINDAGVIVGSQDKGQSLIPVIWANSTSTPTVLPMSKGFNRGVARGINNADQIVGTVFSAAGQSQPTPVFWTPSPNVGRRRTLIYVANYGTFNTPPDSTPGTVSVVDVSDSLNPAIVATVTVGINPFYVVGSPDGRHVYVTNSDAGGLGAGVTPPVQGTVSVIDTGTNTVVDTIPVGFRPLGEGLSPDGKTLYVCNFNSDTISVIDTTTDTVSATISSAGSGPWDAAFSADGSLAFVSNRSVDTVSEIDPTSNTIIGTQFTNPDTMVAPTAIATNPVNGRVYVAGEFSPTASFPNSGNITTFIGPSIDLPQNSFPQGQMVVSPDGKAIYVADEGNGSVSVADAVQSKVSANIFIGVAPMGVGLSPDGVTLYATAQGSDTLSIISTGTNSVVNQINLPKLPSGATGAPASLAVIEVNP